MNGKIEKVFPFAMMVLGIVAGLAIVMVLMAIAVPTMSSYLLTHAEKADFEHMAGYADLFGRSGMSWFFVASFAIGLVTTVFFLLVLNPHCMTGVRNWRSRAGVKLAASVVAVAAWIVVMVAALGGMSGPGGVQAVVQVLIIAGATALLWCIAGETGWAGTFSSTTWSLPPASSIQLSLLFGAAAGSVLFVLDRLVEWTQGRYFILVSEVFDRSGETSFLGFQLLAVGAMGILGTTFLVLGGFIAALAPVPRTGQEVKRRLKAPMTAFVALITVLLFSYGYAGWKYDLDKTDLSGIIGVPGAASAGNTVIMLLPTKDQPVTVQDWPLQVSGSGFGVQSTIELSAENLGKVEAYLARHPDGSVFTYAAREMLYKGYYALGDAQNGLRWQVKAADSQLLPRMLLLARFSALPITGENFKLLEAFSDTSVWSAGGKSALALAKGYQHFGRTADARRWLDKARAAGVEGAADDILKGPVVTDGTVRGRVLVNGVPPKKAWIALVAMMKRNDAREAFKVTDLTLGRLLADAHVLGADGKFLFDRLGSGTYAVAVVVPRELVPAAPRQDRLAARPVPGPVRIGPERVKDLGTIEIVFKP